MKKILKTLSFSITAIFILLSSFTVYAHKEETFSKTRNKYKITRIAGENRYKTNITTIKDLYPTEKVEQIILTSGKDFADALSSYNISVAENSPILLTNGINLENDIKENIEFLKADKILIIGGINQISQHLEDTLISEGYDVKRIAGENRYETNKLTLERTKDYFDPNHRAIVSGEKYYDALSAAPLLKENNWALTLANNSQHLSDDYSYTMIGYTPVKEDERVVDFIIGENRYLTNELINNELINKDHTIFVSAHNFADALSALNYLKLNNSRIILVNNILDLNQLENNIRNNMTILGGQSSVNLIKDEYKKGYALTFDDINIGNWYETLDLLDEYNTKATFYISHNYLITPAQWEMIREMQERGHEIGSHSYTHIDAEYYSNLHSISKYIEDEITPSLKLFDENNITINSYSYPGGAFTNELNKELNKIFPILRGTSYSSKTRPIKNTSSAYVNKNSDGKFVSAIGLDLVYNNSLQDVKEGLDRANDNNEVILFYSHDISHPGKETNNYSIETKHLENILKYAQSLGLKSYTVSELYLSLNN